jgi:hypothetical protein
MWREQKLSSAAAKLTVYGVFIQRDLDIPKHLARRFTSGTSTRRCPPLNLSFTMAPPESGTIAILAEKPSVASDIARVLGATSKGDGYLHGNSYVVAWAIGHLVALAQPHEMNPEWRYWRRDLLAMLPKHWPLVVYQKTKD